MTLQAYRVTHRSGVRYYVLAGSKDHAIERVTLTLGDASGKRAWAVIADAPLFELSEGVVFDEAGKPVTSVEA